MENSKKVWIRGNANRYKEVIEKLVSLGGMDAGRCTGKLTFGFYYIDDGGLITVIDEN